eukprot:3823-Pleurochrysis_carterae.AAC.1
MHTTITNISLSSITSPNMRGRSRTYPRFWTREACTRRAAGRQLAPLVELKPACRAVRVRLQALIEEYR